MQTMTQRVVKDLWKALINKHPGAGTSPDDTRLRKSHVAQFRRDRVRIAALKTITMSDREIVSKMRKIPMGANVLVTWSHDEIADDTRATAGGTAIVRRHLTGGRRRRDDDDDDDNDEDNNTEETYDD